jgi:predicted acyltransferase
MQDTPHSAPTDNKRLLSLDAFRGLTIMAMILVNNPGTWSAVYPPLLHANWNGWTPTDLIFPFFIFMVGVSIVFSLQKRLVNGASKLALTRKVIWRAVNIFLVGMILFLFHYVLRKHAAGHEGAFPGSFNDIWNAMPSSVNDIRFCGVLARIAVVFLICGMIFIYFKKRMQVFLCLLFLVGYWLCMTKIPMPGTDGQIVLEPGNNIAAYIDSKVMPFGHFYHQVPEADTHRVHWDPEGPFSTLPALATCLIGIFAGLMLRNQEKSQERKVISLYFSGVLLVIGGYLWSLCFPINKPIWSSSYVLLTAGFASIVLASCMYYVDILGRKRLMYPAVVFGSNAIMIYFLSGILASLIFYGGNWDLNIKVMQYITNSEYSQKIVGFCSWLGPAFVTDTGFSKELASLCYGLLFVAANFIIAWIMYICRIFVRL